MNSYIMRKIQLIGNTKFISLPANNSPNKGDQMIIVSRDHIYIIVPAKIYQGNLKVKIDEFLESNLSEVI